MNLKPIFAAALALCSLRGYAADAAVGTDVIANGFSYTVQSANLITNGDFSQGFAGWTNGAGGELSNMYFAVQSGSPTGGTYIRVMEDGGTIGEKSLGRGVTLEAGKTYVLSFYHKGVGSEYLRVGLSKDNPTTESKRLYELPTHDMWEQVSIAFNTTEDYNTLVLKFAWAKDACFSDFFLAEAAPHFAAGTEMFSDRSRWKIVGDNLIANCDFTDGLNGWTAGDGKTALSAQGWDIVDGGPFGGKCIVVKGNGGSSTEYSIKQVYQLTPGKTYAVAFWYKDVADESFARVGLSSAVLDADEQRVVKLGYSTLWRQAIEFVRPTVDRPYLVMNFAWLGAGQSSFADFRLLEVENAYAGRAFRIKQAETGLYWATAQQGEVNQVLVANDGKEGYDYTFLFDATGPKSARVGISIGSSDGRLLHRRTDAEKWNVHYSDRDPNEISTNFNIKEIGTRLFIKNEDSNNILGTDAIEDDAKIFNDKGFNKVVNGKNTSVVELEEVPYAFSNRWICEVAAPAETFYASTEAGEGEGQYPAEARDAFRKALDDAKGATLNSRDDIRAAIASVKAAFDTYKKAVNGASAIDTIDASADASYTDLLGRPVSADARGILIRRQGNKVGKVMR